MSDREESSGSRGEGLSDDEQNAEEEPLPVPPLQADLEEEGPSDISASCAFRCLDKMAAEFQRIKTLPLRASFLASLDKQSSELLRVIRSEGGAFCEKTRDFLQAVDQVVQKDEAEMELHRTTMAIFVLREEEGALCPPVEIGIVIDGVEVLNELPSLAFACAMMFDLIYTLNLNYPEELRYAYEAFQKIIMDMESRKMRRRVQNLAAKLHLE